MKDWMGWDGAYLAENTQTVQEAEQVEVRNGSHALVGVGSGAGDAELFGDGAQFLALADSVAVLDGEFGSAEDGGGVFGETVGEGDEEVFDGEAGLGVLLHAGAVLVDAAVEDFGDVAGADVEVVFVFVLDEHDGRVGRGLDDVGADHFDGRVGGLVGGYGDAAVFVAAEDAGHEVGAEAARVAPFGWFGVLRLQACCEGDFEG